MSLTTTQHPGDAPEPIEALLPWYAAGTLDAAETAAVEKALANDAGLRAQLALIREDQSETIHAAESITAPSTRMAGKLFAAIDAEPTPAVVRRPAGKGSWLEQLGIWIGALTPRKLAFAALSAAALVALQAGIVAALMAARTPGASYEVASGPGSTAAVGSSVLVAFEPTARLDQITALLGELNASIVEGPRAGGLFRVRFADGGNSAAMASRLARLNNAKGIVRLVAPAN
ncbi:MULTISPECIES: hypothetical protein [unclassified Chelatococcus]|uniref:hypothetical protein n=1 Tax=unclassified Chelatococcus TaxID=2638111 RepID=UPI001BCEC19A|nr:MULTISPECIES: hypothetical protein [unclassified Chelatococcus]MBS7698811.1 zf-HC2 domain-containing protein [Chelatococcus sp. YT9]MBX3554607.1 zf-HC2 domain-containing protein [Chelatococcus sp.]